MIKTKSWGLLIGILLVLSIAASVWLYCGKASGVIANVYSDGECVASINLSDVAEAYEFTVTCSDGSNLVRVEPNRICVADADCTDTICVRTGWISGNAVPVVCLPHRLVIQIEQSAGKPAEFDAVVKAVEE